MPPPDNSSIPITIGRVTVKLDDAQFQQFLDQSKANAENISTALNAIALAIASLLVPSHAVQITGGTVSVNQ